MDKHMKTDLVLNALAMAYWRRKPLPGLLHHSDRGSQYACHSYQKRLKSYRMIPSMSRKGDCWDNAPTERFFRSLKTERLDDIRFTTRSSARLEIVADGAQGLDDVGMVRLEGRPADLEGLAEGVEVADVDTALFQRVDGVDRRLSEPEDHIRPGQGGDGRQNVDGGEHLLGDRPGGDSSREPGEEIDACKKRYRDQIDAIDAEMRTAFSPEQGDVYKERLLALTRQIRACE